MCRSGKLCGSAAGFDSRSSQQCYKTIHSQSRPFELLVTNKKQWTFVIIEDWVSRAKLILYSIPEVFCSKHCVVKFKERHVTVCLWENQNQKQKRWGTHIRLYSYTILQCSPTQHVLDRLMCCPNTNTYVSSWHIKYENMLFIFPLISHGIHKSHEQCAKSDNSG